MTSSRIVAFCSVLVAFAALTLWATNKHSRHPKEMSHAGTVVHGALPTEGGQSMFSALIEIVAMLEQDDKTDWAEVDIDELHKHLLDMDFLMRETEATTSVLGENQIQYQISGKNQALTAIHRMVPAHASFIQESRGWVITTDLQTEGATLTISAEGPIIADQLVALGFYGFMSLDSHHQAHHFQMAMGHSH